MRSNLLKELCLLKLYEKFITDSKKGKRLQPSGKRISRGTIDNYYNTYRLLRSFSEKKKFQLIIKTDRYMNRRELNSERNYWKKFYKRFTDFLYKDCGHFDNYVGQNIKNVRTFFNYLKKELVLGIGDFYKQFYVRKEEIAIFPLMPEELNYLIGNQAFEDSLGRRMKEVKDFFVFGCTVALRVSDLINLKKSNLRVIGNQHYLSVCSIKTNTETLIKLPPYAIDIVRKYSKRKRLLPHFNKSNLNKFIKQLLELAGLTQFVQKQRGKRGVPIEAKSFGIEAQSSPRFCDLASTHTMRRTAITTMLSLGVNEQLVRKISGHAPGSKEFYRYVSWAQSYQDQETERMFARLTGLNSAASQVPQ